MYDQAPVVQLAGPTARPLPATFSKPVFKLVDTLIYAVTLVCTAATLSSMSNRMISDELAGASRVISNRNALDGRLPADFGAQVSAGGASSSSPGHVTVSLDGAVIRATVDGTPLDLRMQGIARGAVIETARTGMRL